MDFNGDGNRDLLAAGYGGVVYIFYGKKDGSLSEVKVLKDKTGTEIHSGMYYDFKANKYVTVKEIKNNDKLDFARAFDFDNDGDLDLLLSGRNGVKLRENIGSKRKPVFAAANIDITPKHHAYDFIDWDGDGLKDLVCGAKEGGVYYYKNTGKKRKPAFGEATCILEKSAFINKENGGDVRICQIAVTDYNNDGKLDLVVGNPNTVNKAKLKLTDAEIKERDELKKRIEDLDKKVRKAYEVYQKKFGSDRKKLMEAVKKDKELMAINNEMRTFFGKYRKYLPGGTTHGYIFVSLRK